VVVIFSLYKLQYLILIKKLSDLLTIQEYVHYCGIVVSVFLSFLGAGSGGFMSFQQINSAIMTKTLA
jgi:hypothetical protein